MDFSFIRRISVGGLACLVVASQSNGYIEETHERISRVSVGVSRALGGALSGVERDLDLPRNTRFPDSHGIHRTITELVAAGARYEDDFATLRMRNHFFDPQHNGRPLTIGGVNIGHASPDWALEDREVLPDWSTMPRQEFSLRKALGYFSTALSGVEEKFRRGNFGLLFQSIGHAVHHVQDMAQPEHVRNDQHITHIDTSYYEDWTDQNRSSLPLDGYPPLDPKQFPTARSYWTHGGKGIADFTSQNFVSKDTNFHGWPGAFKTHPDYLLPDIAPSPPMEVATLGELLGSGWLLFRDAKVWFLGSPVVDANSPGQTAFNARSSTYSILGADLALRPSFPRAFIPTNSLNRFNFAAAHAFLMPRAVAYSAGLIDYFFRGRLALDSYTRSAGLVTIVVRNVSAADCVLGEREDGEAAEFSLYYDASDGRRHRLALTGDDLQGQALLSGATRSFQFLVPENTASDKEKPFMLVFDGRIGEERGIAALALAAPTPRGFLVTPDYPVQDGIAGRRAIFQEDGQWKLGSRAGLQAGNVDWRGNEPGEVLTWDGPPSRYFYSAAVQGYSPRIYRHGKVLAEAPGNVQGVAIRTDGAQRLLTVVVYAGGAFRVYVRPFRTEYTGHGLYDARFDPDGWRLIGSHASGLPATPVFFNASGTEAQTIVRVDTSTTDRFRQRVRMRIGATLAVETTSAKGTGTWRKSTVNSYEPSVTVVEGKGDPCSSTPGTLFELVCRRPGSCKAPSGETFEVCLEGRREFRMDAIASARTSLDYTFETPTVVCVDYRGDAEVRGEIIRDAASTEHVEFRLRYHQVDKQTVNAECLPQFAGENTSESQGGSMVWSSDVRRLRFGGVEIPLTGSQQDSVFQEHTSVHQGAQGEVPTGMATVGGGSVTYDTRILYLDVRNDIAVADMQNRVNTVQGASSQPFRTPRWTYSVAPVFSYETRRELAAYVGGERHVLHSAVSDAQSQTGNGLYGSGLGFGGKPDCPPHGSNDPGVPKPFTDDFAIDRFLLLNPSGNSAAVTHGYAVDAAGRVAASQAIWVRQPSGAYVRQGTWNFLSNGNLPQLIPPGSGQSAYFPVGVID